MLTCLQLLLPLKAALEPTSSPCSHFVTHPVLQSMMPALFCAAGCCFWSPNFMLPHMSVKLWRCPETEPCIIWWSTLGFVCLFCLYSNIYSHHLSHPLVSSMFFYISGLMVAAKQCLGALLPPSDCSSVLKLVKTKDGIEGNKCKNHLFFLGENLSKISIIHTVEPITFGLWLCCYKKKGVFF